MLKLSMENQPLVNNQVQQEPVNPVPISKKRNYWIIVVIIFVVIVFIGSIFTILLNSQISTLIHHDSSVYLNVPFQPSPAPDETANWKTYTDSKNMFTLKYPPDLYIKGGG